MSPPLRALAQERSRTCPSSRAPSCRERRARWRDPSPASAGRPSVAPRHAHARRSRSSAARRPCARRGRRRAPARWPGDLTRNGTGAISAGCRSSTRRRGSPARKRRAVVGGDHHRPRRRRGRRAQPVQQPPEQAVDVLRLQHVALEAWSTSHCRGVQRSSPSPGRRAAAGRSGGRRAGSATGRAAASSARRQQRRPRVRARRAPRSRARSRPRRRRSAGGRATRPMRSSRCRAARRVGAGSGRRRSRSHVWSIAAARRAGRRAAGGARRRREVAGERAQPLARPRPRLARTAAPGRRR